MTGGYIKSEKINSYAVVEFFNEQHNSLHSGLLKKLAETITTLGKDDSIKCILLRSGGDRTFCAGANFDEMRAIDSIEKGREFFWGFGSVINAMKNCPKLIVGRVQGKAVGGGVGIVSACDIAFATKYAGIRLSELSISIGPFVIEPAVSRKIGLSGFSELTLKPKEWKDAFWAKNKGLYSEVFETTELLDQGVETYLNDMGSYNQNSISEIKKTLWNGTEHWEQIMKERAAVSGKLVLDLEF